MEDQNQTPAVTPTKTEMLQKDLEAACKLLARYMLSNETLSAFVGPIHNSITLTTEIIDNPDAVDNTAVSQKVISVKLTRYTEEDKPEITIHNFPIVNYSKSDKYSYLFQ